MIHGKDVSQVIGDVESSEPLLFDSFFYRRLAKNAHVPVVPHPKYTPVFDAFLMERQMVKIIPVIRF